MCLTCGCGVPDDDMGDPRNITTKDIKEAVGTKDAEGLTADEAIKNLNETWGKVKDEDKHYKADNK